MTAQKLETLREFYGDLVTMDGYDDCIAGAFRGGSLTPVVVYDREKVILKLMASGMDREGAEDFHEFNQAGAFMGEQTPLFLDETGSSDNL